MIDWLVVRSFVAGPEQSEGDRDRGRLGRRQLGAGQQQRRARRLRRRRHADRHSQRLLRLSRRRFTTS